MTALMQAVNAKDAAKVRALIGQGVNINEADASGDYPLVIAAYKGYGDITQILLEAGAHVTVLDPGMKATALHAAAYAGHANTAALLVKHHIDIDKQGPYNGYTALHDAIWQNNIDVARILIDAGANLHIKSNDGKTPLDFAKGKHLREITAMIEAKLASG